ncbi:MAG: winged helix-turn-helix transcriptional regulator [Rhizobiaceae bacterium]|nr:winged helix-turn-helix transcriptional regulator [Rhizobiaceae bacterium]
MQEEPLQGKALVGGKPDDETFVDSYLLYLLAAASRKASEQFHSRIRQNGLRVPEWRVLAGLMDKDGAMVTRLADIALMEQSRLSHIIDQMDKRGLVTRKFDTDDGRRKRIFLTDHGRQLATKMVAEAREHEAGLLQSLADTDAERIKPVLTALLKHLNNDKPT